MKRFKVSVRVPAELAFEITIRAEDEAAARVEAVTMAGLVVGETNAQDGDEANLDTLGVHYAQWATTHDDETGIEATSAEEAEDDDEVYGEQDSDEEDEDEDEDDGSAPDSELCPDCGSASPWRCGCAEDNEDDADEAGLLEDHPVPEKK